MKIQITILLVVIATLLAGCGKVKPASPHTDPTLSVQSTGRSMVGFYPKTKGVMPVSEENFRMTADTTVPFQSVRKGDSIVYRQRFWNMGSDNLVHHAVYGWNAEHTRLLVKGFNNGEADGEVGEVDYVGVVTEIQTARGMVSVRN